MESQTGCNGPFNSAGKAEPPLTTAYLQGSVSRYTGKIDSIVNQLTNIPFLMETIIKLITLNRLVRSQKL